MLIVFIVSLALIIAGVSLLSIPAGLITAGLIGVGVTLAVARANAIAPEVEPKPEDNGS